MKEKIYEFDQYILDIGEHRLQRNGEDVRLSPRIFEVLAVLVSRHSQLVTYDELMKAVWSDTYVEESNLRYSVHSLRKIFGKKYIKTVPKRGYRFESDVTTYTREEFIKKFAGREQKEVTTDTGEQIPPVSDYKSADASAPRKSNQPQSEKPQKSDLFNQKGAFFGAISLLLIGLLALIFAYRYWPGDDAAPTGDRRVIAVLPFEVIGRSDEKKIEIQKGVAAALIFNLSKIKDLRVVANRNIEEYFGQRPNALEAGDKLGADQVIVGTYRAEDDLVQANVRLLDVGTGETLWSKSFAVKEQNQIETERAIALPVARQIELEMLRRRDIEKINDLELSEETRKNYLISREMLREYDFDRWAEATELTKKIMAANPGWASAYSEHARALVLTHGISGDTCVEARKLVSRALEIDPQLSDAHLVEGSCRKYYREWDEAEKAFQRAIEYDSQNARALREYAVLLDVQRRFSEAETMFRRAIEVEPFSPLILTSYCEHNYFDQNFSEAIKHCRTAQMIQPDYWEIPKKLYWIFIAQDRYEKAYDLFYGNLGKTEQRANPLARALLENDIQKYWKLSLKSRMNHPTRKFSPLAIASFYAKLGNREKTLEYLEKTLEDPAYELARVNPDPIYDFLRKDRRFIELMRKIELAP